MQSLVSLSLRTLLARNPIYPLLSLPFSLHFSCACLPCSLCCNFWKLVYFSPRLFCSSFWQSAPCLAMIFAASIWPSSNASPLAPLFYPFLWVFFFSFSLKNTYIQSIIGYSFIILFKFLIPQYTYSLWIINRDDWIISLPYYLCASVLPPKYLHAEMIGLFHCSCASFRPILTFWNRLIIFIVIVNLHCPPFPKYLLPANDWIIPLPLSKGNVD